MSSLLVGTLPEELGGILPVASESLRDHPIREREIGGHLLEESSSALSVVGGQLVRDGTGIHRRAGGE
ncbi:hypothetical protein [Halospeciosus flavus]|uniref:hypothetical protein n=1 Tax=Halospeciosus flavus TaxID=3032283 RepID=UPI0036142708